MERISVFQNPKEARRYKDQIAAEINKANGGAIKTLSWKNTPPMRMAQGGQPSLGQVNDNTRPDPTDSGQILYAQKFDKGGIASPQEMLIPPGETEKSKARLINMGLEGFDALRDLASGKRVKNRLASDKQFLGSEHLKDLMKQYGMVTDEERPIMETLLSIGAPGAALRTSVGAARAAPKAARAVEGGLNAATAAGTP